MRHGTFGRSPSALTVLRRARRYPVVDRAPAHLVEGFPGLHDVEQQGHELPGDGAHRTGLRPAIAGPERQVLASIEAPGHTPAGRQQEELSAKRRPAPLGLLDPPAHRRAALFPRQVHTRELQDLAWRLLGLRRPELRDEGGRTHDAHPWHGREGPGGGVLLDE